MSGESKELSAQQILAKDGFTDKGIKTLIENADKFNAHTISQKEAKALGDVLERLDYSKEALANLSDVVAQQLIDDLGIEGLTVEELKNMDSPKRRELVQAALKLRAKGKLTLKEQEAKKDEDKQKSIDEAKAQTDARHLKDAILTYLKTSPSFGQEEIFGVKLFKDLSPAQKEWMSQMKKNAIVRLDANEVSVTPRDGKFLIGIWFDNVGGNAWYNRHYFEVDNARFDEEGFMEKVKDCANKSVEKMLTDQRFAKLKETSAAIVEPKAKAESADENANKQSTRKEFVDPKTGIKTIREGTFNKEGGLDGPNGLYERYSKDEKLVAQKIGTFKDDKLDGPNGEHMFIADDGSKVVYKGTFKDGKLDGPNGLYERYSKDGKLVAQQKGTFKDDKLMDGISESYRDGALYSTFQYTNGTAGEPVISKSGAEKQGGKKEIKSGNLDFENGKYDGEYVVLDGKNVRTGKGKFTWKNGDVYEGDFVDDKRTGKGKYTWKDGEVYEGDFVDDKRNGKGKYIYSDQSSRSLSKEGEWKDGALINGEIKYKVISGDNLLKLAKKFHSSVKAIKEANSEITDVNFIKVNQIVKIPVGKGLDSVAAEEKKNEGVAGDKKGDGKEKAEESTNIQRGDFVYLSDNLGGYEDEILLKVLSVSGSQAQVIEWDKTNNKPTKEATPANYALSDLKKVSEIEGGDKKGEITKEETVRTEARKIASELQGKVENELKGVDMIASYKTKGDCSARCDENGKILDYIKGDKKNPKYAQVHNDATGYTTVWGEIEASGSRRIVTTIDDGTPLFVGNITRDNKVSVILDDGIIDPDGLVFVPDVISAKQES